MPGVGRHPCGACHYVAANRRMLARHAVLIHSEKVFKCPVCPFITRYAANWYRHKRDLHGLTKVTHCEVCGFVANSTPELAAHKEAEHPEHLQIGKFEDKYAREKLRLSGGGLCDETAEKSAGSSSKDVLQDSSCPADVKESKRFSEASNYIRNLGSTKISNGSSGGSNDVGDLKEAKSSPGPRDVKDWTDTRRSGDIEGAPEDNGPNEGKLKGTDRSEGEEGAVDPEDIGDFFEPITVIEEFGEEQASVFEDLNSLVAAYDEEDDEEERLDESITFSLPLNGHLNGDEFGPVSEKEKKSTDPGSSPDNLGPLKVKRSYNCLQCGLLTSNPREYLYHLKNNHGERISVFECKYCIYASKHVQKLHRHCNLVHRQLITKDPEYQRQLQESKEKKAKPPVMNRLAAALQAPTTNNQGMLVVAENGNPIVPLSSKPPTRSCRNQALLKCSVCSYQTRNRAFLLHHEKTVHLKKKFYRCLQCGYTTSERGRYTKHIKYHSLPKMQCEFCFFRTAYKWNMDRHMRNHEAGAEGAFRCDSCNFTTSTKQSFKSHVTNHHNSTPPEEDNFVEEEELSMAPEEEDPIDNSAEWEDIGGLDESEDSFVTPDENSATNEPYIDETMPENESSEVTWKDGKAYQKVLQCKLCDYKAAWPFEMKKHEENHRSQKKHECPLCGMRFEHIAWLTKHLHRVHQENSQARNIAAAFELMKPTRKRPGKEFASDNVLPIFQDVLKHNKAAVNKASVKNTMVQPMQKNSMLSTLLNKPLQPFALPSLNKYNQRFKSKAFAAATNMSRHLTVGNYSTGAEVSGNKSTKNVPTCNVCGYKTRWISELQRHMRVHSQEKPFQCPKCKYHCKWKGDLNRHLMKYHGIKVPSSTKKMAAPVPKLKLKKSLTEVDLTNDWQVKRSLFPPGQPQPRNPTEEGPLDLTVKETFPNIYESSYDDPYEFSNPREEVPHHATRLKSPLQSLCEATLTELPPLKEVNLAPAPVAPSSSTKRKYQCPFCTFATTTASRFHVHIVQHYNKRPFCCSVCEYNSNWEWDITKHIKLKNCRDKFLNKACVLLTDESGRRNYEKYEKYLVSIDAPPPLMPALKLPGVSVSVVSDVNSQHNVNRVVEPKESRPARPADSPSKNCSYDFRNIGSNFEDTPENIVVTPDINIPDDSANAYYSNIPSEDKSAGEPKSFYCKHCNFRHATKRVVISHLSVHAGLKPFRCRACNIASNWRHVIVRHVKDVHEGCMDLVEDRISYAQEGFAISLTSVHQGASNNQQQSNFDRPSFTPEYGCKICPYKCDKEFYIKFHMRQHRPREGAIYRCEFCPYFVKFKKTLVRHTRLHVMPSDTSMEDTLDLDEDVDDGSQEIQGRIPDRYELYQPMEPAEESITISFDQLNQFSFSDPVSPLKVKRHVCEQCPYKTDNKTQYLYHKQFHRPNPSAPFKCSVCSYWATMQHLLTQHMKVHSGSESQQNDATKEGTEGTPDKPGIEDTPDKQGPTPDKTAIYSPPEDDWADKMTVVYVKREGEVVKMFKCNFCPMMNKKKANVRVHQKMHGVVVKDGKFACSYCDYQCLNQGGLTNHLKIHQKTPEKELDRNTSMLVPEPAKRKFFFSYFCQKCPALFKSANDLEIHSRFHGSGMQFGCTVCDYRTKAKTHLVKHLQVHSPEYIAKREAAQGPATDTNGLPGAAWKTAEVPIVKKIDQMLLLEASETALAMRKTGEAAALLKRCVLCPAPFFKTSTLAYHLSLHGSLGEFRCGQCDYAVSRLANFTAHAHVHPTNKKARNNILDGWKVAKTPAKPRKPPLKTYPCTKCPAVFYKQDRFDRHSELHGKNYKYGCQHCDYSVRFPANLIKHRNLHAAHAENAASSPAKGALTPEQAAAAVPAQETAFAVVEPPDERKTVFMCDRCPYVQQRKDAVQAHQRRHWQGDGFRCPYCDYSSMQNGFLQTHIKLHINPGGFLPPQAFMKFEGFQIFVKDEGEEEEKLLFDDQEMVVESNEEDADVPEGDNHHKKRKHKSPEEGSRKRKLISCDALGTLDGNSNLPRMPVVVLSDVLANKELMKKLKIPKLKLAKSDKKKYPKLNISYDSESKLQSKPSLVVKISKVENSSNEYSICTKSSEPVVPKDSEVLDSEDSKPVELENLDSDELDSEMKELKPVPNAESDNVDETVSSDIVPETDNANCQIADAEDDAAVANVESLANGLPEEEIL